MDKIDIDELKNVPSNLSNWKSKIDELDVNKLEPDLSKLKNVVKNMHIILRSKILKVRYLILLT